MSYNVNNLYVLNIVALRLTMLEDSVKDKLCPWDGSLTASYCATVEGRCAAQSTAVRL